MNPTPGSTTGQDLGYVDIQWTDAGAAGIDPTTFGSRKYHHHRRDRRTRCRISGTTWNGTLHSDGDTLPTGTINVTEVAGQVADLAGNVDVQATQSFTFQPSVVLAPTANAQSVTVAQDTAEGDHADWLRPKYAALRAGLHGQRQPDARHALGQRPEPDLHPRAGYFGPDSFQFTDSNGVQTSSPATVSITVVGKPTANTQSVTTAQDTAKAITLTGSDPNSPALTLTFTVSANPAHGTLSGTAPNLTYTPSSRLFRARTLPVHGQQRRRHEHPGHRFDHDRRQADGHGAIADDA